MQGEGKCGDGHVNDDDNDDDDDDDDRGFNLQHHRQKVRWIDR
jgi:hypothetical protein